MCGSECGVIYVSYCTCLQVGSRVHYTKVPDGERAKAQDVVKP